MEFKVGDHIIGPSINVMSYGVPIRKMKGVIRRIGKDFIDIYCTDSPVKDIKDYCWSVNSSYFRLLTAAAQQTEIELIKQIGYANKGKY